MVYTLMFFLLIKFLIIYSFKEFIGLYVISLMDALWANPYGNGNTVENVVLIHRETEVSYHAS